MQGASLTSHDDLLHVATPIHIGAGGVIEIHSTASGPAFTAIGVYATHFTCSLNSGAYTVTCHEIHDPDIVWECLHFVLTAQAPYAAQPGSGTVAGEVACDSGGMGTAGVNGTGVATNDNTVAGINLGTATTVVCRANGASVSNAYPTGSWQVTCNEPSVRPPYGD